MAQADNAGNPRAVPGNNAPPSAIDSAWVTYRDVAAWLGDNPVIQDEDSARAGKLYWDRAKIALDEMESERDGLVRPLNTQVKEINSTYKQPAESLTKLRKEVQDRMSAFALAEEQRKAEIAEAARKAAEEAEALARAAEAREQEAIANAAQGEFTDVGEAIGEADEAFAGYERANREAARAERDVKGRIGGGLGRAFTVKTTRVLTVSDPIELVRSWVARTGSVPERVADALKSSAPLFEKTFGVLPGGVAVSHVRG